ncbi:MAG: hypothetical protein WCP28_22550, partial [Actinomycetes bacterium]
MSRDGITKARVAGAAAGVAVVVVFALGLLSVLTANPDAAQAAEATASGSTAAPTSGPPASGTGATAAPAAPKAAPSPPAKSNTMLSTLAQLGTTSRAAQARALSLPETGAGSLARGPGDTIRVEIRTTSTSADVQAALVAQGAQIVHVSTTYSTITADILSNAITAIITAPFVVSAAPVLLPAVSKASSEAIT